MAARVAQNRDDAREAAGAAIQQHAERRDALLCYLYIGNNFVEAERARLADVLQASEPQDIKPASQGEGAAAEAAEEAGHKGERG